MTLKKNRHPMGDSYPTEEQNKRMDKAAEIYQAKLAAKNSVPQQKQPETEE